MSDIRPKGPMMYQPPILMSSQTESVVSWGTTGVVAVFSSTWRAASVASWIWAKSSSDMVRLMIERGSAAGNCQLRRSKAISNAVRVKWVAEPLRACVASMAFRITVLTSSKMARSLRSLPGCMQ